MNTSMNHTTVKELREIIASASASGQLPPRLFSPEDGFRVRGTRDQERAFHHTCNLELLAALSDQDGFRAYLDSTRDSS